MKQRTRPQARRATVSARSGRHSGAGGTLVGLFIGLALGLSLAAAVAFYIMKSGSPYTPSAPAKDAAREPARTARAESAAPEKPRFDFYKILPGIEEPKVSAKAVDKPATDRATVERAATPDKASDKTVAKAEERPAATDAARAPKAGDRFWLQAGSFTQESDAENLKARLALAGWEAEVQSTSVADKGMRYRVRLGPYDNADELNRIKGELGKRGFEAAVIKY